MKLQPLTIVVATVAFLALDAVWLTVMGSRLYRPAIGHLMAADVDWTAVAFFYVVYLAGLAGFALSPATGVASAAVRGALFGFVAYATYDLTSQATLRDWPWLVTVIDLCWGTFASAAACAIGAAVARRRG